MGFSQKLCPLVFLLLSFLAFSFLSSSSSATQLCSDEQAIALLQFKNSISINKSTALSEWCESYYGIKSKTESWKEGTDCCSWDGITCENVTGNVLDLNLSCSGLYGSFPSNSSLFLIKSLQSLNLSHNDFNLSKIPREIGQFVSLKHLDLSYSLFSGQVPNEITHLSKLVSLNLSNSELKLEKTTFKNLAQNFSEIRELILRAVNLSSLNPRFVMNLSSSLIDLDLSFSDLKGKFPHNILQFPNLKSLTLGGSEQLTVSLSRSNLSSPLEFLYLYDMNCSELFHSVSKLKSLKVLSLCSCNLKGSIPSSIGNLSQLSMVDLSWNHLGGRFSELVYLDLNSNLFNGTIPSSITNVVNLTSLDLSANDLNESSDLERLDLSNNKIEGQIPEWMWNVGKDTLNYLNLSHNSLMALEQIPWRNMQILDFRSNMLRGVFPVPPIEMVYLLISNNHLFGEISSELCKANSLEILDLSHNNLSGVIPNCLPDLSKNLFVLNLQVNRFRGNMPSMFPKGCKIQNFNLHGNQMEGLLPRSLVNCSMLEVLDIGNNNIKDTFPYWLESLPKLQVLILRSNKFHGFVSNTKANSSFSKLRVLDLSDNNFVGPLPMHYIENLKAMVNAHEDGNSAQYMGERYMGERYMGRSFSYEFSIVVILKGLSIEMEKVLTVFTSFDLSKNKFAREIPKVIGKLSSLKGLNLSYNNFSGQIPHSLQNLTNLEWLDLSSNELVGEIPQELVSLTSLSVLNLSNNQLVGCIPQGNQFNTFGNSSYEGNLRLYGFPLTKSCDGNGLPQQPPSSFHGKDHELWEFGWRVVLLGYGCGFVFGLLIGFDLSKNKFGGEIPKVIGKLRSLKGLNLSHNNLNGSIPHSLGNLTNLEWLDLSSNELVGEIPQELVSLTSLAVLDLSNNQLDGCIPQGNQFNTFENSSYEGNPRLYGFPLTKSCDGNGTLQQPPGSFHGKDHELWEFGWRVVLLGYGCGLVFGLLMGYFAFQTGKPKWFVTLFAGQHNQKARNVKKA
ncbi:hypothetical protein SLEP1_g59204 [Rubroshorea leprosula]|nr:hypothetical protein SLEP1_g59204 [Rubroshorea leprosula]